MTTQTEVLINSLMEQAQVFASSWSLIGGRFDGGNAMRDAEEAKAELRQMIEEALQITWVGLTDEKSQPEEKYCKQAVDGEIPEAYTPAKGGLLPEQKPEPFGIWHQGDTSEECDFFLYADAGDVTCDTCVKLYTAPSKREWVGLTYLEKEVIIADCTDEEQNHWVNASAVADLIEAKLKEKNR